MRYKQLLAIGIASGILFVVWLFFLKRDTHGTDASHPISATSSRPSIGSSVAPEDTAKSDDPTAPSPQNAPLEMELTPQTPLEKFATEIAQQEKDVRPLLRKTPSQSERTFSSTANPGERQTPQHLLVEGFMVLGASTPDPLIWYSTLDSEEERNSLFRGWEADGVNYIELPSIATDPDNEVRIELGKPLGSPEPYEITAQHLSSEEINRLRSEKRENFTGVVLTFHVNETLDCAIGFQSWPASAWGMHSWRDIEKPRHILWRESHAPYRVVYLTLTPMTTDELLAVSLE